MLEFMVGVVFAAGAVWFVLHPIFAPAVGGRGNGEGGSGDQDEDFEEDLSPRAVALRALREIEFDRETGKLSDTDYQQLYQKYTAEALAAMRAEQQPLAATKRAERAPAATPVSRVPAAVCDVHGPRPEKDALFCSECGRRLGKKPGYCSRCGAALEQDARYCNACGTRVAA